MSRRPQLVALHDKYELLLALHRAPPERSPARRDAMLAIAARFPGALREWQALPPEELVRRRDYLAGWLARWPVAAASESADTLPPHVEPWVRYGIDLHVWLRLVLALRRLTVERLTLERRRGVRAVQAVEVVHSAEPVAPPAAELDLERELTEAARQICVELGEPALAAQISGALLAQIVAPPGGQLARIAYAAVAAQHGVSVAAVKQALFHAAGHANVVK